MRRILFDLRATQPLHGVRFHGGGEYTKMVFLELLCHSNRENQCIEVFYDNQYELADQITQAIVGLKVYNCANTKELYNLLCKEKYNIFFSGLPSSWISIKIPEETKFIYAIHGLRELEKPFDSLMFQYEKKSIHNILKKISIYTIPYYWENKYRKKIKMLLKATKNRMILTVSTHSKYSILVNFPELKSSEIKVYNAPAKSIKFNDNNSIEVIKKFGICKQKYFLMVSAGRWLKNNLRAVIAFDQLFSTHSEMMGEMKVVLTGVIDQNVFLKHIKNPERFVMLEYIESETLEALYKEAHAFVYPTLNEGFGYPPIEAMKYSTISICSAVTSVSEVCGDAVLYFNPYDIMEIKNRILQSFDEEVIKKIHVKIPEQFEKINLKQREGMKGIVFEILSG